MSITRATFAEHREQILRFWERARDDTLGGFHAGVRSTGEVHAHDVRPLLIQARQLYNYAEGIRAGFGFAAAHAEHLYEFITTRLRTSGGWYTTWYKGELVRPELLNAYANLFVVIGMARYAQASGHGEALAEAWRLFGLIESDAVVGDLADCGVRGNMGYSAISGRYNVRFTGNVNLHYLEALARLTDAGIEIDLRPRVEALRTFFLRYILDSERMITFDRFDSGFETPWTRPGAHVSLGHGLEWLDFFRCFAGLELNESTERGILEHTREHGVKEDGLFEDAYFLAEGRCARGAEFWPHAEAIKTFSRAASIYGEPYGTVARLLAAYYFEHFVDTDGGVFYTIDRNGVVTSRTKGDHWKCDYHSMRMCVDVVEREGGAFA